MKIRFGTKAETLARLENKLQDGIVLPQVSFTIEQWETQPDEIWIKIQEKFLAGELVVRSSAVKEDTQEASQAGRYDSVLHVKGRKNFFRAVEKVAASFTEQNKEDQILIQPMLTEVEIAGVAFTLEPNTLGNYYVINYDDSTGSTESVTSGSIGNDKLFYCFKGCGSVVNKDMAKVCICLKELEELFGQNNLDVEFAIDRQGKLYIFQVRPLCVMQPAIQCVQQQKVLDGIGRKIKAENRNKPFLYGNRTIYGVMPDWNPAEIIGIRPKPLALSLYKEIITDNIWAYQRDNYGYKNLRSFPLLIDFCGLPYIDVRVSFNSFIPKGLSDGLSEKLVNYYLERLEERPDLHDKIEFEIVFSCYTLDLPERIVCLKEYGFTEGEICEITEALKEMTKVIIDNEEGLWKKDYQKIEYLKERYKEIRDSDLDNVAKIYWLLEDCKRYGTLPFAGLARAGFIAVQLLKSMVSKELITQEEYQLFMGELNTISSTMKRDRKEMLKEAFLKKYGHLRPGTYDINSKRYDEEPDTYFDWINEEKTETIDDKREIFKLSLKQIEQLKTMLREHGLSDDILGVFHFIRTAIEGREFAKFVFTKSLSDAMQLFEMIGEECGYSSEECAFSSISIIKSLYDSCELPETLLKDSIYHGKEKYLYTKSISLPPLIFNEKDVFAFYYPDTQANYITLKDTAGEVYLLQENRKEYNLGGKIILIPSADPGYDWIFSHDIKGFITKYGGANSHMAIRANELGIPAVIGTGEKMFDKLIKARLIQIDTAGKKVNILK